MRKPATRQPEPTEQPTMIDQQTIPELLMDRMQRLMSAVDALSSHTFPQVETQNVSGAAVTADAHAVRYYAEQLRDEIKRHSPTELRVLRDDFRRAREELQQADANLAAAKTEVAQVINERNARQAELDNIRAEITKAKRQAA